jgi:murein DD-endopeptidase MepM/ murein hydrolase activator NlpD
MLVVTTGYGVLTGSLLGNTPTTISAAESDQVQRVLSTYLEPQTIRRGESLTLDRVTFTGQFVGGAPAQEQIAPPTPTQRTHIVASGDTLGEIAQRYGLSYSGTIMLANPSLETADSIYPGQQLVIPAADASDAELATERERRAEARKKAQQRVLASAKTPQAIKAAGFSFLRPINSKYQSQGYTAGHPGLDLVADVGTPIRAVGDGCIIDLRTGWNTGYGKFISFDMGNGFSALYAHLNGFSDYGPGDCVDAGTIIGYSGNTGNSSGPHLHFELRSGGVQVNPANYLP